MKGQRGNLRNLVIDKRWTLFLDRDGVINKKVENDYVKDWSQFDFIDGAIEALKVLGQIFGRMIIVTNQRGIGRGLMTDEDLALIHKNMMQVLGEKGVHIDRIYYCPHDFEKEVCNCRKPGIDLALRARKEFPEINFNKSVMVGDSIHDMQFGRAMGMLTVYINSACDDAAESDAIELADIQFKDLFDFAMAICDGDGESFHP